MRLFIALNLPDEERRRIYGAAEPLRQTEFPVRWMEPDLFHLTLKFLGQTRSEMVPVVQKVIRKVSGQTRAFALRLEGFGAFPTIRRPRVVWLGADPSPALRCLKQDLEWGLTNHGFDRETRAFHPHVTLGRVDGDPGAGAFRGLDEVAAGIEFQQEVPVQSVDLMRSQRLKEGVRYSVVERFPLLASQSGD